MPLSARRLFASAVAMYGLGLLGWWVWPAFRESLIGKIVAIPPFSIYLLEHLGIPRLTDRASCDWMWCKPTMLGIMVAAAVWLGMAWGVAAGIARVSRSRWAKPGGRPAPPPGSG